MATPLPAPSAAASLLDVSQALPIYTRTVGNDWDIPAAEQEHKFTLNAKKTDTSWLTLTVISRASSGVDAPLFFQSGNVTGTLRIDLDKEETVDCVTISLFGRLNIFTHSMSNFLYMSRTLYSASADRSGSSFYKRGRLNGSHVWPYSFRLPKGVSIASTITLDGRAERVNYRLPPAFSDERSNVEVKYCLVVRVDRGGFHSGSKLSVPIRFLPVQRPSPPTILRQIAYQGDTTIVGPTGDPQGWKTLDAVDVDGQLFKSVTAHARCTLSIARPLTFTRGTPIHLMMTLHSRNAQLLDLVTPQSLHLTLVQRITFGEVMGNVRFSRRLSEQVTVKAHETAVASWWRIPDESPSNSVKTFAGEVFVPDDLVPACHILHYGHEYELALYSPSPVGFIPCMSPKTPLLTEPVNIVTAFAKAPMPKSYIPPEYQMT